MPCFAQNGSTSLRTWTRGVDHDAQANAHVNTTRRPSNAQGQKHSCREQRCTTHLAELVPWHVREDVVLHLVVEAAHEPADEAPVVNVARRQHLQRQELWPRVVVEHRHACGPRHGMHACDDAAATRNGQRDRDCDRDSAMAAATVRHASAIATATALRRAANTPLCPTPNAMARKRPHIVWDTKRNISPCDSGMHNLHGTSTHVSGQHAAHHRCHASPRMQSDGGSRQLT